MGGARRTVERSCVGCRRQQSQQDMVRYVTGPGNELLVDYRHKLPGRGAYTCLTRDCIESALNRNGFDRSFRQPIAVPDIDSLVELVSSVLRRKIISLLGMARKAGQVKSGNNSVLHELAVPGSVKMLIVAADAADGTAGKVMEQAAAKGIETVRLLDKDSLGRALGREQRSFVAVTDRKLADALKREIGRLTGFAGEN